MLLYASSTELDSDIIVTLTHDRILYWPSSHIDRLAGKANSPLDKASVHGLKVIYLHREIVFSLHAEIVHNT